jgi:uncharacterized membrane protein YjfL (UPF0719 family)
MQPDSPLYRLAFALGATLVLLLLFQLGLRILSPKQTVKADLEQGNAARAMLHGGDVFGIFLIAANIATGSMEEKSWKADILWVTAFGVAALVLYLVTSRLGVRLLLKSRMNAEIEAGNIAAGIAGGAHSLATGIIVARAVAGSDLKTLGLSLVFFAIAQVTLHILVLLFRMLTKYDDSAEIQNGNVAAALSYAGLTIAVAVIVGQAVEGTFTGWGDSMLAYGKALSWGAGLYVVRQLIVQTILLGSFSLRGGTLDTEIARDKNVGMGAIEAMAYVATALVILRIG